MVAWLRQTSLKNGNAVNGYKKVSKIAYPFYMSAVMSMFLRVMTSCRWETDRIVRCVLILLLLYVGTHLVLSRVSYYIVQPDKPDFQRYAYLPLKSDTIYASDFLTSLEHRIRMFFIPVAYLDYCLTGIRFTSQPLMSLSNLTIIDLLHIADAI